MKWFLAGLILFSASPVLEPSARRFFVVWNVGQGLWTTFRQAEECWHFDVGGERFQRLPWQTWCGSRRHRLFLSHWDWDHIAGWSRFQKVPRACLNAPPGGQAPTFYKSQLLKLLPTCAPMSGLSPSPQEILWSHSGKSSNDASRVWLLEKKILLPGDSTSSQESLWIQHVPAPQRVQILVLGHHGSRTSTSIGLLEKLPGLRMAIASARRRRYGHPHLEVIHRLAARRIPLLITEDWGSLRIEI